MNSQNKIQKQRSGFTLIEILVVIGLITVLAAVVLVAVNPARQFAQGRDVQRTSHVETILNAVGQNIADNKGVFCASTTIPAAAVTLPITDANKPAAAAQIGTGSGNLNLEPCLVPAYVSALPADPNGGTAAAAKYYIVQDSATYRISVFSDQLEPALGRNSELISITR